MNIDQAITLIKTALPIKRFDHSLRVAEVAIKLANVHNVCQEKTKLAAVLHDYAKFRSATEMKRWIESSTLPKDLLMYNHAIWHGPVGALIVQCEHGINDRKVLDAIRYHTTGRPYMTLFEKVLFVADYIEPARNFPGLDEIRKVAFKDIDQATLLVLKNMIQHLMGKGQSIYPDTFNAYNELNQSKS